MGRRKFSLLSTLSLLMLLGIAESFLSHSVSAATIGENLIINGDAEAGSCDRVGNAVGNNIPEIPGWNTTNNFSVLCYNATGFEFVNGLGQTVNVRDLPSSSDSGPGDRGNNLFYGGGERASSSAFQIIDLTSEENIIDRSLLTYRLSGWLGGYSTDDDRASLTAIFQDGVGQTLGNATLIAPTPEQRNNSTGLLYRSTVGLIPVGTRSVSLLLEMNHVRGRVNDAYADNLSFVVTPVPEPLTVFGVGTALGLGTFFKTQITKSDNKNRKKAK